MVNYIEFKGEKHPIRVSYKAMRLTKADLGRDFKSNDKAFDYEGAETLLFHAMKIGAKDAEKELTLERKQMVDVLDEGGNFHAFIEAYTSFFLSPHKGGDT